MTQRDAVFGLEMVEVRSTNNCSPYVEGTMTNTPMRSRTILEARPSAVLHIDDMEMNFPLVGGAKYLVTIIDEASGYVKTCHIKT